MRPPIHYKAATAELTAEYIRLRGLTRENPISSARLEALGVTAESWSEGISLGETLGVLAESDGRMIGYCFGSTRTGEVLVLAVLPDFESQGIGRQLLAAVVTQLRSYGHTRLFLGCSTDPIARSHGFYRRLGWRSTGTLDKHGDEVLELLCS